MKADNSSVEKRATGEAEAGTFDRWRYGCAWNIGARKEQQDNHLVFSGTFRGKPALLALVADGMGGMHDGALYSKTVRESHEKHFQKALDSCNSPAKALLYLALQAEKDTLPFYNEDKLGGTTLVSALFVGDLFYALSVGDSRITLFRRPGPNTNKAPLQINREHTMGVTLDERAWMGFISFEDASDNLYRDSLTSSIGTQRIRHLDLTCTPVRFMEGDQLVLMSDGIYRSCSEGEMSALLEYRPETAAPKIVEHICSKKLPRQDNMTIMIIEKGEG